MYKGIVKNLVLIIGIIFPLWSYSALLAPKFLSAKKWDAIIMQTAVLGYVQRTETVASLRSKGCPDDKIKAMGFTLYPPQWEAFQQQLAAMTPQERYAFLSNPPVDHPVLSTFTARLEAAGGPHLEEWFQDNLDQKFSMDETLRAVPAERVKFNEIIESVREERLIHKRIGDLAATYNFQLTEEQKRGIAERVVRNGMPLVDAIAEQIEPVEIRGHVHLTQAVAQWMIDHPTWEYTNGVLAVKEDHFRAEIEEFRVNPYIKEHLLTSIILPSIMRAQGIDDIHEGFLSYLKGKKKRVSDDTHHRVIELAKILEVPNIETLYKLSEKVDAFKGINGIDENIILQLAQRLWHLSQIQPQLSLEERRLTVLAQWIFEGDEVIWENEGHKLTWENYGDREIMTHIAQKMMHSKNSKEHCWAEFLQDKKRVKDLFDGFGAHNYAGRYEGLDVANNQRLFSPIIFSQEWSLNATGGYWDQGGGFPIIDRLIEQWVLRGLGEINQQNLTRAMAHVIELKEVSLGTKYDAYFEEDPMAIYARVNNKLLRTQFKKEAELIAEYMFRNVENPDEIGVSFEEAQREIYRCFECLESHGLNLKFLREHVPSSLEDIRVLELIERVGLLENPMGIAYYQKLAKTVLDGEAWSYENAFAKLESLKSPIQRKFREKYGIQEWGLLEEFAQKALFGGDNLQPMSDKEILSVFVYLDEEIIDLMVNHGINKDLAEQIRAIADEPTEDNVTFLQEALGGIPFVTAKGGMIQFEDDPLTLDSANDAYYRKIYINAIKNGYSFKEVTADDLKAYHLACMLSDPFANDPSLKHLHATPADILDFAKKMLRKWLTTNEGVDFIDIPVPKEFLRFYKKAVPDAVIEAETVLTTRVPETFAKRSAAFREKVHALPETYRYEGFNAVLQNDHDHPAVRRYFNKINQLIGDYQRFIGPWRLNFEAFSIDIHASDERIEEVTPAVLRASFNGTAGILDCQEKLGQLVEKLCNHAHTPVMRGCFSNILHKLRVFKIQGNEETLGMAYRILEDFNPGLCHNHQGEVVDMLEKHVLGSTSLSIESAISTVLLRWRLDLIDRAIVSLAPKVAQIGESEQKTFLKITGGLPLGLPVLSRDMPYMSCVRVNLIQGQGVPYFYDFNERGTPYNENWRFERVWNSILGKMTVDAMVEVVQSIIDKPGTQPACPISCKKFQDWATNYTFLWEYVDRHGVDALWDGRTRIVKADVIRTVLYGLGYLDFIPPEDPMGPGRAVGAPAGGAGGPVQDGVVVGGRMDLPDCFPRMRRSVLRGARMEWIGTDPATNPEDPTYG